MLQTDKRTGIELKKCKYCKTGLPVAFQVDGDLYYVKCNNPACHKWDRYEFCATNRLNALNNWNKGNTKTFFYKNQED